MLMRALDEHAFATSTTGAAMPNVQANAHEQHPSNSALALPPFPCTIVVATSRDAEERLVRALIDLLAATEHES